MSGPSPCIPITVAIGSALAAFGLEPQPYKASKIVS